MAVVVVVVVVRGWFLLWRRNSELYISEYLDSTPAPSPENESDCPSPSAITEMPTHNDSRVLWPCSTQEGAARPHISAR